MRSTNERELVTRLREGDEKAFATLYADYSEVLHSFLIKLSVEKEDIKDVIQQTFVKLWENRQGLKDGLSLQSYLITIAKNDIYNMVKKRVLAGRYQASVTTQEERTTDLSAGELQDILQQILLQLPEKRRQVFSMSKVEGYSNKEIAELLDVSKSTVENHLNHSSKQLKGILKKLGLSG